MEEPLKLFYHIYGYNKHKTMDVVMGEKYLAVLLKNGNMGVCATLLNNINPSICELDELNMDILAHRILYTAWLNAVVNYKNHYSKQIDIFELINFHKYNRIVMIGYFKPVAEKLRSAQIDFSIFDLYKKDDDIVSLENQAEYIRNADAVILTATSIFNNTFRDIVCNTSPGACDIFILGPSAILDSHMLQYRNIKNIFGFVFPANGEQAIEVIRDGGGTRSFNKFGSKVYI